MQDNEEMQEFGGRPSKSARKREAAAAQDLGTKLIDLKESDLRALNLGEKLLDAILLAKRITSRGGLARQRQYIGKLMYQIPFGVRIVVRFASGSKRWNQRRRPVTRLMRRPKSPGRKPSTCIELRGLTDWRRISASTSGGRLIRNSPLEAVSLRIFGRLRSR